MALAWPLQFGLGVLFGFLANALWTKGFYRRWPWRMVFRGRHVHHSIFGLVLIAIGIWQLVGDNDAGAFFLLSGLGSGLILDHSRREGRGWQPVFMEKL
jgi:hypothetical protein